MHDVTLVILNSLRIQCHIRRYLMSKNVVIEANYLIQPSITKYIKLA